MEQASISSAHRVLRRHLPGRWPILRKFIPMPNGMYGSLVPIMGRDKLRSPPSAKRSIRFIDSTRQAGYFRWIQISASMSRSLIYARQFINGRRLRRPKVDGKDQPVSREIIDADWQNPTYVENGNATMNRLYMVETNYTATGAMADHRLALRSLRRSRRFCSWSGGWSWCRRSNRNRQYRSEIPANGD